MISKDTIELIRQAVRIEDVLGEFITLKQRGSNYIGLCPFHDEKTPSFVVSPSKDLYKCFGCGKSGNSISYLVEREKMSYPEALKWLAEKYNIEVDEVNDGSQQSKKNSESLFLLNKTAQDFYHNILNSEKGHIGKSYFEHRGFDLEHIKKFKLGYAPNSNNILVETLLKQQFNKQLIIESGLGAEKGESIFDNYRDRGIFPIHDFRGNVVGFGARILTNNSKAPKYINSPQNEIFNKSNVLYGIFHAKDDMSKQQNCYIVEGYTDVITMHQKGITNVVSSSGTSLTINQLKIIQRLTDTVTLIFDSDNAGITASQRSIDLALSLGLDIQLITLPDKEDPDSFCKANTLTFINEYFEKNSKDFLIFLIEQKISVAKNNVKEKTALINQIATTLSYLDPVSHFVRQEEYIKTTSKLLDVNPSSLTNLVKSIFEKRQHSNAKVVTPQAISNTEQKDFHPNDIIVEKADEIAEKELMKLLLHHGTKPWDKDRDIFTFILNEIDEDESIFSNDSVRTLFIEYKNLYENKAEPNIEHFKYHEDPSIREICDNSKELLKSKNKKWDDYFRLYETEQSDPDYIIDIKQNIAFLKIYKIQLLILENQKEIKASTKPEEIKTLVQNDKIFKEQKQEIAKELGLVII